MKPELAVFGGSFDPPHVGHLFLATFALGIVGVERVLVVPTFEHAFAKPLTAFEHRMAMCARAFAALPAVEVSPIERELGGTSRTLRLLHELARRFPAHQLRLLIGSDILADRARWQGFDQIEQLAPPIVVTRGGHGDQGGPIFPQVSSTELRAALARGEPDAQVLSHEVRAYIAEHQLYA